MQSRLPCPIMSEHPGYNFVGGGGRRGETTLRYKQWKSQK
jgi:hypothetical protein